ITFSAHAQARRQRPAPSFASPGHYRAGDFAESLAIADLSGDGVSDIATAHGAFFEEDDPRTGAVTVFVNHGDGSFEPGVAYQTSTPGQRLGSWSVAAGDLNGDGVRDLATANPGALRGLRRH